MGGCLSATSRRAGGPCGIQTTQLQKGIAQRGLSCRTVSPLLLTNEHCYEKITVCRITQRGSQPHAGKHSPCGNVSVKDGQRCSKQRIAEEGILALFLSEVRERLWWWAGVSFQFPRGLILWNKTLQNNTNVCCYTTISLFHTHTQPCRQTCPQALRVPWPLSLRGTSPAPPMPSHPVVTLCCSGAPWTHRKDWKPHLLGPLHSPGMNPERKTDVSLAEPELSRKELTGQPACRPTQKTSPWPLPPLSVQECRRVTAVSRWAAAIRWAPQDYTDPRLELRCACIAAAAGLHLGVLQYQGGADSPFHLPCVTITGQAELSQPGSEAGSPQASPGPSHWPGQAHSLPLPAPHWTESICTAVGVNTNCTELIH